MPVDTPVRPKVFTSWKEMASYLGKGVRTVQRWEKQFGLPVHRPNGHEAGIVHAFPDELDRWLVEGWSRRRRALQSAISESTEVIQGSHELRDSSRQLLMEVQRSLEKLTERCHLLTAGIKKSQDLGAEIRKTATHSTFAGEDADGNEFATRPAAHRSKKKHQI